VYENRVLRRIFRPEGEEVAEGCIMRSFITCTRVIISRRMKWNGRVARMGEMRNAFRFLVGKREEKRPLRRPRCRWEGNVDMYFRETGWEDVDWLHLGKDRDRWRAIVETILNLRVT
jgi:hypothetical protein